VQYKKGIITWLCKSRLFSPKDVPTLCTGVPTDRSVIESVSQRVCFFDGV